MLRAGFALMAAAACCAVSGCSIKRLQHALDAKPGAPISELVDRDRDELVELAVRELLGEGNAIRELQPDPQEAPAQHPLTRHAWVDHVFLADQVFAPWVHEYARHRDPAKRRKLAIAICEWRMHSGEVQWDRTPGEAIDLGVCPAQVEGWTVLKDPGVRYAMAQVLLEGHPKREPLLDEFRLRLAETIGGRMDRICFDFNGHSEPVVGVNRGCYLDLWETASSDHDFHKLGTAVFHPSKLEERSQKELALTAAILLTVSREAPQAAQVRATLGKLAELQQWKAAEKLWPLEGAQQYVEPAPIQKALAVLEKIPVGGALHARAQERIKEGRERLAQLEAEAKQQAREWKAAQARAAEEERRYLATLAPGLRQVYEELGPPEAEEPGPGGGKVWRYEDPIYSNVTVDRYYGTRLVIGYRWREYAFDAKGALLKRSFGGM